MKDADSCIAVLTSRNIERMLRDGGSQAWKIGSSARRCRYLVCIWNAQGEFASANEPYDHGEAFLVAPIASIEPAAAPEPVGRSIIRFTSVARISVPQAWNAQRNPVWYTSLSDLGIEVTALKFEPVEVQVVDHSSVTPRVCTLDNRHRKTRIVHDVWSRPQRNRDYNPWVITLTNRTIIMKCGAACFRARMMAAMIGMTSHHAPSAEGWLLQTESAASHFTAIRTGTRIATYVLLAHSKPYSDALLASLAEESRRAIEQRSRR